MAKLEDFTRTAGMNGGASVYAKMTRVTDIQTDPELSGIFPISEETLNAVIGSMKERGYDKAEPVVIWKGRNIVVDGHTRLKAAGEAGIAEIPVEEKEFETIEDAILYAYSRQANRRNLTQAEIYGAAVALKDKAERDGNGRAAEQLAKLLDISESTIYRARAIDEKASPEVIEAVKNGDMSINKAYQQVKKRKTPVEQPNHEYAPPDKETGPGEDTASEEIEIPESIDNVLPDTDSAFSETETFIEPEKETEPNEETAIEMCEIPGSIEIVLPDADDTFSETEPVGEAGIISMVEQVIETIKKFLERNEGEETAELSEAIMLLQKVRNQYITGGEPS